MREKLEPTARLTAMNPAAARVKAHSRTEVVSDRAKKITTSPAIPMNPPTRKSVRVRRSITVGSESDIEKIVRPRPL
jgi:hypothetical protein